MQLHSGRLARFTVTLCLLFCLFSPVAHAFSRAYQPIGHYARAAGLIVIADIEKPARDGKQAIVVRETLKGTARAGVRLTLSRDVSSVAGYIVPLEATGVAVLFAPHWEKSSFPVLEVYRKPEEIEVLRELVKIYELPSEREQLLALQKRAADPNPLYGKQLIEDFRVMRDLKNFDLVIGSHDLLNAQNQAALLRVVEDINDLRGVPLLIRALDSLDATVRWQANHALMFRFPGASGVTEAYRRRLDSDNPALRTEALRYLAKREPALAAQLPSTPWMRAQQLLKTGQKEQAVAAYFALLEAEPAANFSSLHAAQTLLPLLDEAGKTRLRALLVDSLTRRQEHYYAARNGIQLLRELRHPDTLPALLFLMHDPKDNSYNSWEPEARAATFAIRDLEPSAWTQAAKRALEKLENPASTPAGKVNLKNPLVYLLQMVWLADDDQWQRLSKHNDASWQNEWRKMAPLRAAATAKDEGPRLTALLQNPPPDMPWNSMKWIIARLGDLREPTAVAPLFNDLSAAPWRHAYDTKEALISIGGPDVEAGAMELLKHHDHTVRREAMDILRALKKETVRPLLRRILAEDDFGNKAHAAFLLGYVGTPDDLPVLVPLTDFWKTDRALQSRATEAVANVRDRFNYDINGPISPA